MLLPGLPGLLCSRGAARHSGALRGRRSRPASPSGDPARWGAAGPGPAAASPAYLETRWRGGGEGRAEEPPCTLGAASGVQPAGRVEEQPMGAPYCRDPRSSAAVAAQAVCSGRVPRAARVLPQARSGSPELSCLAPEAGEFPIESVSGAVLHEQITPPSWIVYYQQSFVLLRYCAFHEQQDPSRGAGTTGSTRWFCVALWDLLCSSLSFLCCFFPQGRCFMYIYM